MSKSRQTIGAYVKAHTLNADTPDATRKTYSRGASAFQADCREHGISLSQLTGGETDPRDAIQAYERRMEERGLSPDTIHTRLAPVCVAFCVPMSDIDKPRRTAATITRSRNGGNARGVKEMQDERYARPVALQRAIGVRESELYKIRGGDLTRDESGNLCVHIERGKGGKETLQRVLPDDAAAVRAVFDGAKPDERVFSDKEHARHIDYHGMRHEAAQRAYDYYKGRLDSEPRFRNQCYVALLKRWDAYHVRPSDTMGAKRYDMQRARFRAEIDRKSRDYETRGTVREAAIRNGRPTAYDRTAVMMVSVFHLSHWRADVTVKNYLTA